MAKINISIDDELLERMDVLRDKMYMSRSGMMTQALSNYINGYELQQSMKMLAYSINKIAETGEVDDETKKELDDFNRLAKMLGGM